MSSSLITDAVLATCLGSVASYVGATLNSDSVATGMPVYSGFGSLIDLTDGLSLTRAAWTLDAMKQSAIVFKDNTGTTIATNPKNLQLIGLTMSWSSGTRTLVITAPNATANFVTNVAAFSTTFAFIHSVVTAVTGIGVSFGRAIIPLPGH